MKSFYERMREFPVRNGETICGPGSTMAFTKDLRVWLPALIQKHKIGLMVDAGCGDRHWINTVDLGCDYRGFDLHRDEVLDFSREVLPKCDLILCRHALIHMTVQMIQDSLSLFKQSSPLLLTSNYDTWDHSDNEIENRRIRLTEEPFCLESTGESFNENDASRLELFAL